MEIASISKTITAAATVKLISDQGLSLTDQIGPYFPESWEVHDDVASLTFEDLLLHNTGFESRRVKYADLKEAVENGPDTVQTPDYNTTNYSLFRILLPYVWFGENRAELDDIPEPGDEIGAENDTSTRGRWGYRLARRNRTPTRTRCSHITTSSTYAPRFWNRLGYLMQVPVIRRTRRRSYILSATTTLPGYETPSQHLHVGGMGWNLSASEVARFMAGLGNHPDFTADYQTMKASQLGLSDTFMSAFGTMYAKGGNNFRLNNDHGGGGSGPTRINTMAIDLPNDYQVAVLRNSNGNGTGGGSIKDAYENAWTGVVVQGDNGDNDFELRLNPSDPNLLDLVVDGDLFFSFQVDVLNSLELRGLGGTDTFLIEDVPATLRLVVNGGAGEFTLDGGTGVVVGAGNNSGNVFDVRSLQRHDSDLIDVEVDATLLTTPADAWQSLDLRGLGGADTFYVKDLPQDLDLDVRGGTGSDTFEIGNVTGDSVFDYVHGNLTILGGAETDYVNVDDGSGSSSDYTIEGIKQLEFDASIDASDYTPGKLFLIGEIEDFLLEANALANTITVTGIAAAIDLDIQAGFGGDEILVSEIGTEATVNVFGGQGDDTLNISDGDLGAVRGQVTFDGGKFGSDQMILNDVSAPAGRVFQINSQSVSGTNGFGGVASYTRVEDIILKASDHGDDVNVESFSRWTELELFGNKGDDVFFISGIAHDVDAVEGSITIHGGNGSLPKHNMKLGKAEEDDQVYVYDDETKETGDFAFNHHGSVFNGRLNKFVGEEGFLPRSTLNVMYDQIERTYLYADDGANTITVNASPLFNQLWLYAAAGDDTIDIESTPDSAAPMRVYGEAGTDTIRVGPGLQNLGSLDSELIVDGGTGIPGEQDSLLVSDFLSGNVAPYQLTSGSLTRGGSEGISYAFFENLEVALSNADNEIDVVSTAPGTATVVHGHDGVDVLTASNLKSAVTFNGGNWQDRAVLRGTVSPDTITATGDTLTLGAGSLTTDAEILEIDGLDGTDRLDLMGTEGVDEAFAIFPSTTANRGTVTRNSLESIMYKNVEEVFAAGNPGDDDTLQVNGQTDPLGILGGAYNDRFNINLTASGTSADPVITLYQGKTTRLLTLVDYQNLGVPTVNGLLSPSQMTFYFCSAVN